MIGKLFSESTGEKPQRPLSLTVSQETPKKPFSLFASLREKTEEFGSTKA
jgi:hypothetical protein